MAVDADEILVIFQGDIAAEVGAEGPSLIVIFGRAHKKGRVVDDGAEILHDFIVHFDAYAHLNSPLGDFNAVFPGDVGHPFGTDSSGCQDDVWCMVDAAVGLHPLDRPVTDDQFLGLFRMMKGYPFVGDMVGHLGDVVGEVIAAQMFLFDDEQVYALFTRLFADGKRPFHIGREDLAVHVEEVENGLGLVD